MSNERFDDILKKAAIFKAGMEKKGLERAKAKCPYCEGFWHGVLVTTRRRKAGFGTFRNVQRHLHFKCDGTCGSMMMS